MSRSDSLAYRADIDGLRAIAVIAVIVYHLNNASLPSGFAGVDCFFVISGFVVTGSILRSQTGDVVQDLLRFWRRRWLRIIPALAAFIFASILLAALFLPPFPREVHAGTLRTGVASLFGFGNLYLYRIGQDYFQADQTANVFSHTWSLGVEEQFYVFFSLLLLLLPAVWFRSYKGRARALLLGLVTVASFFFFIRASHSNPVAAYYFLRMRLWELGIGSALSMWSIARPNDSPNRSLVAGIQVFATAGLLAGFFFKSPENQFPTFPIVIAVMATAVVIATGTDSQPPVSRVLSFAPIVFIGLMSYSLYLWHWPIFTVFRFTIGLQSPLTVSSALAVTVLAAAISYHWVEQRWRRSRAPMLKQLAPRFGFVFLTIVVTAATIERHPGVLFIGSRQRWSEDWLPDAAFSYGANHRIDQANCLIHAGGALPSAIPAACKLNISDTSVARRAPTVLALGDSHSFADWGMIARGPELRVFNVIALSHDGCSANTPVTVRPESCRNYWERVPDLIRQNLRRNDIVFLSFLWSLYSGSSFEPVNSELSRIDDAAREVGAKVIVEAPLPTFQRAGYTCTPDWFRQNFDGCQIDRTTFEMARAGAMKLLEAARSTSPAFYIWDPLYRVCSKTCLTYQRQGPIFRDKNHLSYYEARSLGPDFAAFVSNMSAIVP